MRHRPNTGTQEPLKESASVECRPAVRDRLHKVPYCTSISIDGNVIIVM